MRTIIVDISEAWAKASKIVAGLRFRTFEERLRNQCSQTTENNLPEGVTIFTGSVTEREEDHIYMYAEVIAS